MFLCPQWSLSCVALYFVLEIIAAVVINVSSWRRRTSVTHHQRSSLIGHTSLSLSTHHVIHCADCPAINMSDTFACLFLFLLTLPLHEVTIPLFFFLIFFPFYILSHLFFFPDFFYFFVLFLTTASWNRSGWHPRSLTGQCTSHLPRPLLSSSDSLPLSRFFVSHLVLLSHFVYKLSAFFAFSLSPSSHPFSTPKWAMFANYANFSSHSVLFTHCLLIFVSNNPQPELT